MIRRAGSPATERSYHAERPSPIAPRSSALGLAGLFFEEELAVEVNKMLNKVSQLLAQPPSHGAQHTPLELNASQWPKGTLRGPAQARL